MRSILLLAFITWQGSHCQLYGSLGGKSQINLGRTQLTASGNINADTNSGLTHHGSFDISQNPDADSHRYGMSGGFSNEVGLRFPQNSWWNRDPSAGNINLGATGSAGLLSSVGNWADQHITGAENALTNGMQAVGTASNALSDVAVNAMNRYTNSLNNRNRNEQSSHSAGSRRGGLNLGTGAEASGNYGNGGVQSITTPPATVQHGSQLTANPSHLENGEHHAAISIGGQLGNRQQSTIESAGNFMDRLGNRLRQPAANSANILSNLGTNRGEDSPQAQRPLNTADDASTNGANILNNAQIIYGNAGLSTNAPSQDANRPTQTPFNVPDAVGTNVANTLGNAQNSFENVGSQIGSGLQSTMEGAGNFMDRLRNRLRQPAADSANILGNLGGNLAEDPKQVQRPFNTADAASTNVANTLGNAENEGSQLGSGLQSTMEGAGNFMDRLGNRLRQPAADSANILNNLGTNRGEDSLQAQRPFNTADVASTNVANILNNAQNIYGNAGLSTNIPSQDTNRPTQTPFKIPDAASTNVANIFKDAQNSFGSVQSQLGNSAQSTTPGAGNFMDRLGNRLRQPAVNNVNILSNLGSNRAGDSQQQIQRPFNSPDAASTNIANILNNAQNIFGNAGLSGNTQSQDTNHPSKNGETPAFGFGSQIINNAQQLTGKEGPGNQQLNNVQPTVSLAQAIPERQATGNAQGFFNRIANSGNRIINNMRQVAESTAAASSALGAQAVDMGKKIANSAINAGSQLLQITRLPTNRGTSSVGVNNPNSLGAEVGANGHLSVQSDGQVSQGPASSGGSLSTPSILGGSSTHQSSTGTPSASLSANGQVSRNPGSMDLSIGGSLTTNNSGLPSVGLNVNGNAQVQPSTNTATQQSAAGGFKVQFVPLGRLLGLPFGK